MSHDPQSLGRVLDNSLDSKNPCFMSFLWISYFEVFFLKNSEKTIKWKNLEPKIREFLWRAAVKLDVRSQEKKNLNCAQISEEILIFLKKEEKGRGVSSESKEIKHLSVKMRTIFFTDLENRTQKEVLKKFETWPRFHRWKILNNLKLSSSVIETFSLMSSSYVLIQLFCDFFLELFFMIFFWEFLFENKWRNSEKFFVKLF